MNSINFLYFISPFLILNLILLFFHPKIVFLLNIYDQPNSERKFHSQAIPLSGGLFIFLNITLFFLIEIFDILKINEYIFLYEIKTALAICFCTLTTFCLGLYDDKNNLGFKIKLFGQIIILLITLKIDPSLIISHLDFVIFDTDINLSEFSIPFTILCLVFFINAINYFDGIDLQCILYSLVIFIVFLLNNIMFYLVIIMIITLCFLFYLNFHKKLFLGDSGSTLLGLIIAILIIKTYNSSDTLNTEQSIILVLLPIIDLIRVSTTRFRIKKNIFKADRNHLHHLLIQRYGLHIAILISLSILIFSIICSFYFHYYYFSILLMLSLYLLAFVNSKEFNFRLK